MCIINIFCELVVCLLIFFTDAFNKQIFKKFLLYLFVQLAVQPLSEADAYTTQLDIVSCCFKKLFKSEFLTFPTYYTIL